MGNTASNTNNATRPSGLRDRAVTSPHRKSTRSQSPSPGPNSPHRTHRSLRQKKKSLELPDLASLGLSPVNPPSGPYSRRNSHRTSSPIPIPPVVQALPNPYADNLPNQRGRRRQPSDFALNEDEHSTHVPIYPVTDTSTRSSRGNPFIRGAPLKYTSTQSFTHASSRPQPQRPYDRLEEEDIPTSPGTPAFVPEAVRSTIPIALHKAEMELFKSQFSDDGHEDEVERDLAPKEGGTGRKMDVVAELEEGLEPIPTKIYWKGGGKTVVLARAGDDNWKGRQPMEIDQPPSTKIWSTVVHLLPGTHHLKFIVDDQWRVADSLPTAVDDEGSLSNYVAVHISGYTPPSSQIEGYPPPARAIRQRLLAHQHAMQGQSFWSDNGSSENHGDEHADDDDDPLPPTTSKGTTKTPTRDSRPPLQWTGVFPPELLAAAAEEESYLASSSSAAESDDATGVAAPNIPPAPVLPRHLDKLILNVKREEIGRARGREGRERKAKGANRSMLGMTAALAAADGSGDGSASEPASDNIPVITPSGTHLPVPHGHASQRKNRPLEREILSDDASVLPVPSHVVLHHLSTSAIRNGVLAVGSTTRYRKKFLTTIYYKPT
ncbi:hypothetical protein HWV62_43162 [Athelia sp. TMB]|nr:hypothetical protein HWV62_43162 [Athelia sp. TMB]